MVGDDALEQAKFLSLRERCDLLWQQHGLHVSPHGLQGVYKRHGIGYHFARTQARSIIRREPDTSRTRSVAAKQLLSLVAAQHEVIYVDEVCLQARATKMRTWMKGTHDLLLPQVSVSIPSVTVYVGVLNVAPHFLFMVGNSTNSAEFASFLRGILSHRRASRKPLWLVMDLHSAHTARINDVRALIRCDAFRPFFLPAATSWFNR